MKICNVKICFVENENTFVYIVVGAGCAGSVMRR